MRTPAILATLVDQGNGRPKSLINNQRPLRARNGAGQGSAGSLPRHGSGDIRQSYLWVAGAKISEVKGAFEVQPDDHVGHAVKLCKGSIVDERPNDVPGRALPRQPSTGDIVFVTPGVSWEVSSRFHQ